MRSTFFSLFQLCDNTDYRKAGKRNVRAERSNGGVIVSDKIDYVLPYCEGKKVLDVGFVGDDKGYGSDEWRHEKISNVADYCFGIDIQKDGVEKAREDGWSVEFGNVEDFDLDEKFDVVVAMEVFEHVENLGLALESIRKHLYDDGLLIVTTPNPRYARRSLGSLWNTDGHVVFHHPASFEQLADRHDFGMKEFQWIRGKTKAETFKGNAFFKFINFFLPPSMYSGSWMGVFEKC
jgi:2-polyprenyl-3-methyl-5-hydroxy-6-metoxy-1,4-benzoquinol methylase